MARSPADPQRTGFARLPRRAQARRSWRLRRPRENYPRYAISFLMPQNSKANCRRLPRTRAPRRPKTLPRPVAPDEAVALAEDASAAASEDWIGARDLAILLLLYGAGLRVAEALSLTGSIRPIGQALRVTGKRSKTRVVPIMPAIREAIDDYVRQCPWPIERDDPLVRGRAGWAAQPGPRSASRGGGTQALEAARHPDAARLAPQLSRRICSLAVPTCGRSKSFLVTPACRRRKFTRQWTRPAC